MELARTFSLQNLKEVLFAQQGGWLYRQADSLSAKFNNVSCRMLDNGLSVSQRTAADDRATRMRITVNSGAAQDPAGKEGTAHMVEHMVFLSPVVKKEMERFSAAGGEAAAYTTVGKTVYELSIKKGWKNERMMHRLAASMLFNPEFTESDLEQEKTVVVNEIFSRRDSALTNIREESARQAFGNSIGERLSGKPENVKGMTTDDLAAFHREHYVPANLNIEISGLSLLSEIFDHIKSCFGGIPDRPLPEHVPLQRNYAGGFRHMGDFDGKISQTHIAASFALPDTMPEKESAASGVLLSYLHQSLHKKFRGDEKRYLYSFGVIPDFQNALITFIADISPENASIVLPAISEILTATANGTIDESMFKTAIEQKKKLQADIDAGRKLNPDSKTSAFADLWDYHKMSYLYGKTKPQDLQRLARGMLSRQPTLVIMGDARNVQSFEDFKSMLPQQTARMAAGLKATAADAPAGRPAVS